LVFVQKALILGRIAMTAEKHNLARRLWPLTLEAAIELDSIHLRHTQVAQDQIVGAALQAPESPVAIVRGIHLVPIRSQRVDKPPGEERIVIHDENAGPPRRR
jgi:hypothetical protein